MFIKNKITPGQLGSALHKTVEKHRRELTDKSLPEKKIEWVKITALNTIKFLEREMADFNRKNGSRINSKDLVTALNQALHLVMKTLEPDKK